MLTSLELSTQTTLSSMTEVMYYGSKKFLLMGVLTVSDDGMRIYIALL